MEQMKEVMKKEDKKEDEPRTIVDLLMEVLRSRNKPLDKEKMVEVVE